MASIEQITEATVEAVFVRARATCENLNSKFSISIPCLRYRPIQNMRISK